MRTEVELTVEQKAQAWDRLLTEHAHQGGYHREISECVAVVEQKVLGCTCPNDDMWKCVDGTVYGPCSSDNCYGVCEMEGRCDCPLHADDVNHEPLIC